MKNISIFASALATTLLLQACGISTTTKSESKRTGGMAKMVGQPSADTSKTSTATEGSQDGASSDIADADLHITEAYLTSQLAMAEATQATKAVAPIPEVKATSEKVEVAAPAPLPAAKAPAQIDALATAHTKIDEAFDAKLKQHPGAMSAADAEFIKAQLNLFVKQSVSKDTAAATATWNGITTRLSKIKACKSQQGLALTRDDGDYYPRRGGLLTTLIGGVGRVLSVGVRLVAEIVSVVVPTVVETAVELVDTVFYVLV